MSSLTIVSYGTATASSNRNVQNTLINVQDSSNYPANASVNTCQYASLLLIVVSGSRNNEHMAIVLVHVLNRLSVDLVIANTFNCVQKLNYEL